MFQYSNYILILATYLHMERDIYNQTYVLIGLSNERNYLFSFYNLKLNQVFVGNLYHETINSCPSIPSQVTTFIIQIA